MIADYGTLLRKMRLKGGLTQDQLAAKLNISRTNISKMENGKQGIQVEDFFAWTKSTNGQEVLIAFLHNMDILTAGLQVLVGFISIF